MPRLKETAAENAADLLRHHSDGEQTSQASSDNHGCPYQEAGKNPNSAKAAEDVLSVNLTKGRASNGHLRQVPHTTYDANPSA